MKLEQRPAHRSPVLAGWLSALIWPLAAAAPGATFLVNSSLDEPDSAPDGICETAPGNGVCTLRAAFEEAQSQTEDDVIQMPPGDFVLASPLGGILAVDGDLSIVGAGAPRTTIRGDGLAPSLATFVYHLNSLSLDGVTIAYFAGTAIRSEGNLGISDCSFAHNGSSGYEGGSIRSAGALWIARTAFAYGTAAKGGEIFHESGTFECHACVFEAAFAETYGGAVYLGDALTYTTIRESLFAGNATGGLGGAIHYYTSGSGSTLRIVNSTFHANSAASLGGAISALTPGLEILSSTITDNVADSNLDGFGTGGGVFTQSQGVLYNSILSGNVASITLPQGNVWAWPQDCAGTFGTNGYNIVRNVFTGCGGGDPSCCTFSGGVPGTADPQLGSLAYNGGLTRTRSIAPGSPAVDAGHPAGCVGTDGVLLWDQRGAGRPANGCDLGAFEFGYLIFADGFENWNWKWSVVAP